MDRKEMSQSDLRELLSIRLRKFRSLEEEEQERLGQRAWEMVQKDVEWPIVLAATRAACSALPEDEDTPSLMGHDRSPRHNAPAERDDAKADQFSQWSSNEQSDRWAALSGGDLAATPPPPVRHEVGRYERERLSSNTRQAIRMARHARRWHEIRKMRNVLLNIDQAYLKRMLGTESDALSGEINALLRSWAPLVKDRQGGGRAGRRRR